MNPGGANGLAAFILEHLGSILDEWDKFAGSLASARHLDTIELRDHAEEMLRAIAVGMQTEQTAAQQQTKSEGKRAERAPHSDAAAKYHGTHRFEAGFDINEMVSEYRALRASVIRKWHDCTRPEDRSPYELLRFNEEIDEALAESIARFAQNVNQAREMFMGILSHDLRAHLQVIVSSSTLLRKAVSQEARNQFGMHIEQSANQVSQLAGDLLDVARTRLGAELPLAVGDVNVREVCEEAVRPFIVLVPQCQLHLQVPSDLNGRWDRGRILQLLSNLVRNALQHGDKARRITICAIADLEAVNLSVHNFGIPIPVHLQERIFQPLQRGHATQYSSDHSSLGLGLYIARMITDAHKGSLTVRSSEEDGTTFTAYLPTSLVS